MEKRLLELERAVWDLKIRLKVLEGLHGIRGQSALSELPECFTNGKEVDRLDAWAQGLG